MLIDALVSPVPAGSPLSLVGGAGVGIRSNIMDLLGLGSGVAPSTADYIGTANKFGADLGIGELIAQMEVLFTTGLTTGNAATLNVAFQAAEEDATTHLPSTWVTLSESGYKAAADLGTGKRLRMVYPVVFPETLRPRFWSILFQPLPATNFTAGAVVVPVTMQRDDWAIQQQPRNYAVKRPNGT